MVALIVGLLINNGLLIVGLLKIVGLIVGLLINTIVGLLLNRHADSGLAEK